MAEEASHEKSAAEHPTAAPVQLEEEKIDAKESVPAQEFTEQKQEPKEQDSQQEKQEKQEKQDESDKNDSSQEKQPPGGFDSTPIPHAPPGYTVKFTFHRATNLPMADVNSLSSDPFILAQLNTGLQSRHKEDPYLRMRSFTVRRNTNPEWNFEWIVANVPASGFKLKARIYDEDPADHDDRLGNVHVNVGHIDEKWPGIKNQSYNVRMRMGSKRAYFVRALAVCFQRTKHMRAELFISAEVLGRTPGNEGGRCYTIGPGWWTKHYSPLLGRIANRKETAELENPENQAEGKGKSKRYKFVIDSSDTTLPV